METSTSLWLGGQSVSGEAMRLEMTGGVRSTTVTVAPQVLLPEKASNWSCAVMITLVPPSGYGPGGVCTSVMLSPSGSEEPLSTEAGAEHAVGTAGTVTFLQVATGGRFAGTPLESPLFPIRFFSLVASSGSIRRSLTIRSTEAAARR